jgi:hypothetical protein
MFYRNTTMIWFNRFKYMAEANRTQNWLFAAVKDQQNREIR